MKTLIIINCIVAFVTLVLALEIVEEAKTTFRKDYPTAKLNKVTIGARFIGNIALIVKSLIPIYNLFCVIGFLFLKDKLVENGYDALVNRIVTE